MDKKYGILVICAAILVLCFVTTASARTWYVDDDGGADFIGIQEVINNASAGDTILVYSGVYYENVVVNKSVTLMGIGQPVVDAGGAGDAITLNADGITLVGFTATGSSWFDAGIKVISNNNTITGNNASNNNWHGISLSHSSNNTITGNNACNNNPGGISLSYSSNNTITGNNACNNSNGGISLLDSSNNSITGNNVSNNNWGGISLSSSSNNTITGNTFVNDGLLVGEPYQNTVEDNTVDGKPLVYLEDASDYKVTDAGQVILVNCSNITVESLDISNTSVGIELWETEDCILSNNKVSNNSRNGISLYDSSNNTITGNTVCNNKYGGIYLHYSSSDNTITGNNVSSNWNGIGLRFSSNNNTITENNVSNNNRKGIDLSDSNNNTITGNIFVNDGLSVDDYYQSSVGDNIVNDKPLVYLEDMSDFVVEEAGQVILVNCNNITVENQDLSNTSVGVSLWKTGNSTILNNTVSNNSLGGIDLSSSSNNTIIHNNVYNNDFGIYSSADDNLIYLNNFIDNTDNVYYCYSRRTNIWNSTEKINYTYNSSTYTNYLGNYWDDYEDNYPDAEEIDDIGIWDTPYSIDGDRDNYPLTMRFEDYITPTPANIVIWYAHYDAAGNDHYNLNDEYIVLKNIGGTSINLEGGIMKDKENHTYVFPSFELLPGATVTIRTGSGTDTATDLYWGSKRAIWNNKGDTAYLYDANGDLVDTKSW